MCKDLIDFAVSDTWRDYYYEIGLTPYPSPSYYSKRDEAVVARMERIERLLTRLVEEVARMRQAQTVKQKTGGEKGEVKKWHTPIVSNNTGQNTY